MSVDAHCHVDLHKDPSSVVQLAVESGLRMVAVTTTPAAFKVSSGFSDIANQIYPALGMHPEVVGSRPKDITLFPRYLEQVSWVGEIGLDGSKRFRSSWDTQLSVFEKVLKDCQIAGGRLLSIHSRSASAEVIEILKRYPTSGIPVLHWFSGPARDLAGALEIGAYFSVNGKMLQSASGRSLVRLIPLDRLLTESDAPFASSSEKNVLEQIEECEFSLAELLGLERTQVQRIVDTNFDRIISNQSLR